MGNPFVHALILVAAILIPGGLIFYFAWRATRKLKSKAVAQQKEAPKTSPLKEAREALFRMYPKDSLRKHSKKTRLERARAFRRSAVKPSE